MKNEYNQSLERRKFLKRAAYSAPVLVSMGKMLTPTNAMADATGGHDVSPVGFFSVNKRVKLSRPKR